MFLLAAFAHAGLCAQVPEGVVNRSAGVIAADCTFDEQGKMFKFNIVCEQRLANHLSAGGGFAFGFAVFTHSVKNEMVALFNPYLRLKANLLKSPSTPILLFDAGYMVGSETIVNYGLGRVELGVINGFTMAPAVGVDIRLSDKVALRPSVGVLFIEGTGKKYGDASSSNVFVSVGCKF